MFSFASWRLRRRQIIIECPHRPEMYDLAAWRERVKANPTDPAARLRWGSLLHTDGMLEEALAEYSTAIRLLTDEKDPPEPLWNLSRRALARRLSGNVLELLCRIPEACREWQSCMDDYARAVPDKRHLEENDYYRECRAKLREWS